MDNLAGSQEQPHNHPAPAAPNPKGRPILRIVGYIFLGLAFLVLFYGAVAYFGWRTGEADRVAAIQKDQEETIMRQIELAEADIGQGNYQLALRRLDFVLANEPAHEAALDLQAQANTQLAILLTPTVTPTPLPTPTSTPLPTQTPISDNTEERSEAFEAIQELVDDENWVEAVPALESFRMAFPDFRRREVDEMLYEAYVNFGLTLTRGSEIERGVFFLTQAADLGDLSEEVLGEIFWAEQYLEGIVFYGLNWEAYLSYFRPMCEFAPLYQESCLRLSEGLVEYAQQNAAQLEYCPAEALYREALRTGEITLSEIESELTFATDLCLVATPTPEINLTLTPEIDEGEVVTNSFGLENNSFIPPILMTATPTP